MGDTHDQDTTNQAPQPGHILVPHERSWTEEPADPYQGVKRDDPFQGRPPTEVIQPEEPLADRYGDSGPGTPVAPGQPLPRQSDPGRDET